jgi:hypothetical protein
MTRRPPSTLPISTLANHLSYDPETGLLTWRKPTSRHTRIGDEAGHVTVTGAVIVSLLQHKMPASTVCWALSFGEYPAQAIEFINRDKRDLRLSNLRYRSVSQSDTPKAVAMREYRQRKKERDLDAAEQLALAKASTDYPNVAWSKSRASWAVYEPRLPNSPQPFLNRVLARTPDHDEAMLISDEYRRRMYFLADVPDLDPALATVDLGARGYYRMTLGELYTRLAYDPETGEFIWREPAVYVGTRADLPVSNSDRSPRYVSMRGRRLYAHMLAWFMTYHVWPRPKAVLWHDDDPSYNAIHNLYLRTDNV